MNQFIMALRGTRNVKLNDESRNEPSSKCEVFNGDPVRNFNVAIIDQRIKMKRGKNIFNIGPNAKLDY